MPAIDLDVLIPVGVAAVTLIIVGLVLRSIFRDTGTIKNGVPGTAVIQQIVDTGMTISAPTIGADAPVYRFGLLVSPSNGSGPYPVESKQAVPRLFLPFVAPGAEVSVDIDPMKPERVKVNWQRFQIGGQGAGAVAGLNSVVGFPSGGETVNLTFVNGKPVDGIEKVASAVRSGSMPTTYGSAAQLLAKGTRGTAVITTAMPLGKRLVDMNPSADPAVADDPMWIFTVEVKIPGEAPFPAVFGHRVPRARAGDVAPGMRLQVAVNLANRNQECAIDWDASPA